MSNRTALDEARLGNLSLHDFALYHAPLTLLWFLDHAFDFWCLRRFAFADLNLFTEVVHVIGRAALAADHWRRVGLSLYLVLEALVLIFDGQAFAVEFRASEKLLSDLLCLPPPSM